MADYKFKPGDEVIWLKPVKVKLEKCANEGWVRGRVIKDNVSSDEGEWWHFYADSGIWQSGEIETRGILVHPGFTVTSGPEPERKPVYQFNDKDIVLVRDFYNEPWEIAVFKREWKDVPHPYYVYDGKGCGGETPYTFCIPYAGNEQKMGEVTED